MKTFKLVLFSLLLATAFTSCEDAAVAVITPPFERATVVDTIQIDSIDYAVSLEVVPAAKNKVHTPYLFSQADPTSVENVSDAKGFWLANWKALLGLLLVLVEGVLRLTPSERDNSIFSFLKMILDSVLPNFSKPNGKHP